MGSIPIGLSASRIAALIGLNKWTTPLHAFQTIMEERSPGWNKAHGYKLPTPPDNAAIRFGLNFEDAITRQVEQRHNKRIINREKFYSKKIGDITLTTHLDGEFEGGIDGKKVLEENKTTNIFAFNSTKKEIQERLNDQGQLENGFSIIRFWGDDMTEQTPVQYQVQCSIQRQCAESNLVILHALVFDKVQDYYEQIGWEFSEHDLVENQYDQALMINRDLKLQTTPDNWARTLTEMGNLHEFHLPTNKKMDDAIIDAVHDFNRNYIIPEIPPDSKSFADFKRLMPSPLGSIIATPTLTTLCKEYSENTRQLGTASPIRARQERLKPEIMNLANQLRRSDPTNPPTSFLILDPDGGDTLATIGKDKNGVISFRAARAK